MFVKISLEVELRYNKRGEPWNYKLNKIKRKLMAPFDLSREFTQPCSWIF